MFCRLLIHPCQELGFLRVDELVFCIVLVFYIAAKEEVIVIRLICNSSVCLHHRGLHERLEACGYSIPKGWLGRDRYSRRHAGLFRLSESERLLWHLDIFKVWLR